MLLCWLIMSLSERLSSKFHICLRSFASRPQNFIFTLEASLLGQIFIFRPRTLSADIPAARRGLFTKLSRIFPSFRPCDAFRFQPIARAKIFGELQNSIETRYMFSISYILRSPTSQSHLVVLNKVGTNQKSSPVL